MIDSLSMENNVKCNNKNVCLSSYIRLIFGLVQESMQRVHDATILTRIYHSSGCIHVNFCFHLCIACLSTGINAIEQNDTDLITREKCNVLHDQRKMVKLSSQKSASSVDCQCQHSCIDSFGEAESCVSSAKF